MTNGHIQLIHCRTDHMCADIFTKHFTNLPKWQQVLGNIAHVNVKSTWGQAAGQPASDPISKASAGQLASPASSPCDRVLIEFCCGPESELGKHTKVSKGCDVIRLTEENDVTTPS